jgi:SAM-dependent methyltransferase
MYDGRSAALYDRVVGTRIYNRLVWGDSPANYAEFAKNALREASDSWLLDAGGGSLLFTADAYAKSARPILVLDQSVSMLARARRRLVERVGRMPDNVVLLQGDLLNLSGFVPGSIGTILCLGVLHHIDAAADLVANLGALLVPGKGRMHFTTLITSGRWSDSYLRSLYRSGGFAPPRSAAEVRAIFETSASDVTTRVQGSMLYASGSP